MKKGLISKAAYQKFSAGHPWLTAKDIQQKSELPNRPCATLFGDTWWLHSPESFLRLRRLGPNMNKWMFTSSFNTITSGDKFKSFFGEWLISHFKNTLLKKIAALQLDLKNEDLCLRWVFSENDLVPGLIVDLFKNQAVCQINSAPVDTFWFVFRESLIKSFAAAMSELNEIDTKPLQVIELRNSHVRAKEGLSIIESEHISTTVNLRWSKFLWQMTPAGAQKTGAYFDQRDNHLETADLALEKKYKTAWDLCSYQGGFSLHLLAAGLEVTAVDQSQAALDIAASNVRLNTLDPVKFTTNCADIFEWLKNKVAAQEKVDLIVLDPPSFVKSRNEVASAVKGYIELNTLAMKCLNPGGALVSSICSHHISPKIFNDILAQSAKKSETQFTVIAQLGPAADHAPVKGFDEGHYLQTQHLYFAPRN